jgi:hypothetical protein
VQYKWDVFLSHKRSDAKDLARALYTLLTLHGIKTFLDFVGAGGGGGVRLYCMRPALLPVS